MSKHKNYTMKSLPESERPYERLELSGAGALTDAQLLAIVLRSGTSKRTALETATDLLADLSFEGRDPLIALSCQSLERLRSFDGIGRVKAIQIQALLELAKRISKRSIGLSRPVTTYDLANMYMNQMRFSTEENVWVVYLNSKNMVLSDLFLGSGTLNYAIINERLIFKNGFERGAYSFVLLHSHPSTDPTPSKNDLELTARLKKTSELMGLYMVDHIIIGDKRYFSFLEEGIFNTLTDNETKP
ncbi:MAG: DNA repair protein RadC [Firmicutes bacterium]|nr:DNA repair protein RadC [Bacillota bacterium]